MNPQEFENQVKAVLNGMSSVPPEKIRPVVRQMLEMLGTDAPQAEDKEQFIEQISKSLESKLDLTMPDAAVVKLPFEEWITERRANEELFYWNRYRQHLLQVGFSKEVVGTVGRDTDKIVGLLENPQKEGEWKRRGLVVGHVQSGKTANYSGVISKGADYGYKIIILLAGMHNNLRSQTQQRLHVRSLPGTPDICLPRYRVVIFVQGCFWHRHEGCRLNYVPASNRDAWLAKFQQNVERDRKNIDLLVRTGWRVFILWECGLRRNDSTLLAWLPDAIRQDNGEARIEWP